LGGSDSDPLLKIAPVVFQYWIIVVGDEVKEADERPSSDEWTGRVQTESRVFSMRAHTAAEIQPRYNIPRRHAAQKPAFRWPRSILQAVYFQSRDLAATESFNLADTA
jgi:hypothetical protein